MQKKPRENLLRFNWAARSFCDAVKGNRNNWQLDSIVPLATLSAFESQIASRYQNREGETLKTFEPTCSKRSKGRNRQSSMLRQIQLLFQIFSPCRNPASLLTRSSRSQEYQAPQDRIWVFQRWSQWCGNIRHVFHASINSSPYREPSILSACCMNI